MNYCFSHQVRQLWRALRRTPRLFGSLRALRRTPRLFGSLPDLMPHSPTFRLTARPYAALPDFNVALPGFSANYPAPRLSGSRLTLCESPVRRFRRAGLILLLSYPGFFLPSYPGFPAPVSGTFAGCFHPGFSPDILQITSSHTYAASSGRRRGLRTVPSPCLPASRRGRLRTDPRRRYPPG